MAHRRRDRPRHSGKALRRDDQNHQLAEQPQHGYHRLSGHCPYVTGDTPWHVSEGTFVASSDYPSASGGVGFIAVTRENATGGAVYVDEIGLYEDLGNGAVGPQLLRDPNFNTHLTFDPERAAGLDAVLADANAQGKYLKLVISEKDEFLINHFAPDGLPDVNGGFFDAGPGTPTNWLHQAYWRYLFARYGAYRSVQSWELVNRDRARSWPAVPARRPVGHAGRCRWQSASGEHLHLGHASRKRLESPYRAPISYVDFHAYVRSTGWLEPKETLANNSAAFFNAYDLAALAANFGKPVVWGEQGIDGQNGSNTQDPDIPRDTAGTWLHKMIWARCGPGGVYPLYWYSDIISTNNLHSLYGAWNTFMSSIPFTNGHYQDIAATVSTGLRVMGQRDLSAHQAYLWIDNPQDTWRAVVNGTTIPAASGTVTFNLQLPNAGYTATWYSTQSGTPTGTQTVTADSNGAVTFNREQLADRSGGHAGASLTKGTACLRGKIVRRGNSKTGRRLENRRLMEGQDMLTNLRLKIRRAVGSAKRKSWVGIMALALLAGLSLANGALPTPAVASSTNSVYLPIMLGETGGPGGNGGEWSQFAGNAQHTSYTPNDVPAPWQLKWTWNGPNSSGGVSAGKFSLVRNGQPVTGGGQVYIAAGSRGIYALNAVTGAVVWNSNPGGSINSTVAYDADTGTVFAVSTNGVLYKLDATTGNAVGQFSSGGSSTLPLPPVVLSDRVIFSMGNGVYAVNKYNTTELWAYDAASPVQTPPAYSPSRNEVIVVSQDLNVHAISNATGQGMWKTCPTPRTGGDPAGSNSTLAEASYGWPVIAEVHGVVFVKYRLDWQALWIWSPWPSDNATMRSNLQAQPAYQALFALSLDSGAIAFRTNIGDGGWGDGNYLPMGPQPVVKVFPDGSEVAYVVMRGSPCLPPAYCDGRGDSRLGEMMLDSTTVPGYQAGDVRFMVNTFFPTDEQVNLSMAGDQIFGGHWMFGIAHQILDRSASKGTSSNPITTSNLPHIITSASNCAFSASHYCANGLTEDGDPRTLPAGFYIYYNAGMVYNQYWSDYATWVISNGTLYFVSNDGAVLALQSGNPSAGVLPAPAIAAAPAEAQASLAVPDKTPAVISYTEARQYAGQTKTVEGVVQQVFNSRLAVYLGFKNPHQGAFLVRIMKADWGNFAAAPETLYHVGETVHVTGLITWYQGDPVIYVTNPDQIEVLSP